jgi:hypothetical protein
MVRKFNLAYIFLDESGDLGFDFTKESSTHFVITLLICEDKKVFDGFKTAVKHTIKHKLNRQKKLNSQNELKSTRTLLAVKKYFLDNLRKQKNQAWYINSIILDKQELFKNLAIIPEQHRLYNLLSKVILEQVSFPIKKGDHSVQLIVDSSKGKKQRAIFNQYLKTNIELLLDIGVQFSINHEKSHNNAGLQAVDLFCAGFSRKYSYNDIKWYSLFKDRIRKEVLFDYKKHK